ncbi:Subtilisin-like protease 10 [Metarhizium anisopliae]
MLCQPKTRNSSSLYARVIIHIVQYHQGHASPENSPTHHGHSENLTALIATLSLGAAAPAQDNAPSPLEDAYIVTLKQGISSRHVESHVNWARAMHDASLGRRALGLPRVDKTNDLGTFHV